MQKTVPKQTCKEYEGTPAYAAPHPVVAVAPAYGAPAYGAPAAVAGYGYGKWALAPAEILLVNGAGNTIDCHNSSLSRICLFQKHN